VEAYRGRVKRQVIPERDAESPFTALRRTLDDADQRAR
jgi:hypothetical protein